MVYYMCHMGHMYMSIMGQSRIWVILVISGLYAGQIWVVRVTCGSTMGYIGHMGHVWVMMWGSPMGHIGFLWVIRVNNGSRICHKLVIYWS